MRAHSSTILPRLIRAAMRSMCRYRVACIGYDHRNRIIGIATNSHRLPTRGWHAEEKLIHRSPRSLARIEIVRIGHDGQMRPIDPCPHCRKLADARGITISRYNNSTSGTCK